MTLSDQIALGAAIVTGIAAIATVIGLVIAVTANSINRAASKFQREVAERQIYLSLIDRRTRWFNDFLAAMLARQQELRVEADAMVRELNRPKRYPVEEKFDELLGEAEWLFDKEVMDLARSIARHLDHAFVAYRDWYEGSSPGDPDTDDFPERHQIAAAHEDYGRIQGQMRRYLFVGDIYRKD